MVPRAPQVAAIGAPMPRRFPVPLGGLLVAAVALLAWPFRTLPAPSLDLSWEIGLHQAALAGLRFGHDIVFTYGPLGFLSLPTPFVGPTSALAFVAMLALVLVTAAVLLHESRRLFPLWAAVVVTLVAARALAFIRPPELLEFVAFALGVELIRRRNVGRPDRIAVAAGGLAAVAITVKLDVGVFVAAGAGIVVLAVASPRLRGLLVYSGAFAVASVGIWLVARQQLPDLVTYVRASIDVISGFSEAMAVDKPHMLRAMLAFGGVAAVVVVAAYRESVAWPRDRRAALAALLALLLFALWKHGFVRSHFAPTFVTLGWALLVLMPRTMPRWVMAGAFGAAATVVLVISQVSPLRFVEVTRSASEFVHQAGNALLPWRWAGAAAETRRLLVADFAIPQAVVDEIAGRTVHIDPFQAAVPTAYPVFEWRPVPIYQSYQAYTSYLDEMNAALLRSAERPERILRKYESRTIAGRTVAYAVDRRNYWFESPAATLERLCRYREVIASQAWQVLADTGHGCGAVTSISRVTVALGETVPVPAAPSPDSFVLARVLGLDAGLPGKLRVLAWRAPKSFVIVDGLRYRLVPATAEDGLVLAVPPAAQGSPPFAFGDPVRAIAVRTDIGDEDGMVTFEFVAVSAAGP